jgi:glucose/arabinose dehydrogenase
MHRRGRAAAAACGWIGLGLLAYAPMAVAAGGAAASAAGAADQAAAPTPDADNGGLELPDGFGAVIVARNLGRGRHIVVRENGDIYMTLLRPNNGGAIVGLRDTDGDGAADERVFFNPDLQRATGLALHDGFLYAASSTEVVRYELGDALKPTGEAEVIVSGFRGDNQHHAKTLAFDEAGNLYVNVGANSNACQERMRTPGSPGMRPCPQLEYQAGVWRYDANATGQTHPADGERYATGLRHCVAIDWRPAFEGDTAEPALYVVQHGRDQLNTLFPDHYDASANAELPAEEFHRLERGSDAGWPYTYWDPQRGERMVAPEYGGDGETPAEDGLYQDPIDSFPAHWAPNDLVFYTGEQFPSRYRRGAFVAFHGSWNRAPKEQAGYKVVFVPFGADGLPSGEHETFAEGFAGVHPIRSPRQAEHRPCGVAVGPDGSLYITDSVKGFVWRVFRTVGGPE